MIKRSMSWDQALLRKFSSTGHFRLLNQVRTELKAQPLQRDPKTNALQLQAKPMRGQPVRAQRRPNPHRAPTALGREKPREVQGLERGGISFGREVRG